MPRRTHCDRVLDRLQQGPATHLELYALGCVAHSRISDLRKKGYAIRQWREGDLYHYELERHGAQGDPATKPSLGSHETPLQTFGPLPRTGDGPNFFSSVPIQQSRIGTGSSQVSAPTLPQPERVASPSGDGGATPIQLSLGVAA